MVAPSTWALLGAVAAVWTLGALLVGVGIGRIIRASNRHLDGTP